MDVRQTKLKPNPEKKANPISRLFLLWVIPFLRRGAKKDLNLDDVYHSLPEDSSAKLGLRFEEKWNEELTRAALKGRRPRLWKVILRIIWVKYIFMGVGFAFDELVLRTIQPLALRNFIKTFSVENPEDDPKIRRDQYIDATILVVVTFLHSVFVQKLIGCSIHMGIRKRLGVSSLIYQKILGLQKSDSEHSNVGKLCNLLASDVGRLDQTFNLLHFFYIAPCQLAIYTYLLYNELGVACFGGLGAILIILPSQVMIGRFFMYFRVRIARRTDERGRFLNEIIGGVRLIKMYAWEKPFASVISKLRRNEIKFIRRSLYLRGFFVSVHSIASKLMPFCALILYVALGNTLTASKAFFSISIFNTILQAIMNRIPNAASQFGELVASLNRIENFLLAKDNSSKEHSKSYHFKDGIAENGAVENGKANHEESYDSPLLNVEPSIIMQNYSASWSEDQETLKDLTVNLRGNKLVMVVGHVGSGKSSFLNAILSELPITSDDKFTSGNSVVSESLLSYCRVQGRKSYASQEAWIFPATVRQNILFGLDMDEERYRKVIKLCCLRDDLKQFPDGDMTVVGEKGVSLSGGQKARVNLARAIYQKADVYLLDDPLSAVDTRVSKRLFNECIKEHLDGKLRILVTHQLQYLPMADHIIVLNRDGGIWGQGTYEQLANSDIDFTSLISDEYMNTDVQDIDELQAQAAEKSNDLQGNGNVRKRVISNSQNDRENKKNELTESVAHKKTEEQKNVGSVGVAMYFRYFRSGGSYLTMICLVLGFLSSQVLNNFTDYWLSEWTNAMADAEDDSDSAARLARVGNATKTSWNISEASVVITNSTFLSDGDEDIKKDQDFYTYVYCGLMAGFIFIAVFRSLLFFRYCMKISINLHDTMFESIVRAPVKFFDDNPSGRIMNRFTKDLNYIDEYLPVAFYDYVTVLLLLFGTLAINILANYFVAVPSAILLVCLWKLRAFYLSTARDLKRIESVAKSPMFTHVTMTVQGLTTIRALKAQERVQNQFEKIQDTHTSVFYMMFCTGRWFALWLEMMSVIFLTVVSFGFLLLTTSSQGGNVGVAISSILSLSGALQWGIRQSAETENYMTSVERAFEYSNLKPEAPLEAAEDAKIKQNWPNEGRLNFQDVSLAYDSENANKVLKEISFSTKPGEKVGIVGRTGAGKSSLITALFRLTEPCNGTITIDDVPIGDIGLHTLRSRISIIPQDPVLFTGSLRYNLDPFNEFKDDQLWNVLQEVDLHHTVQNLDCPVADGGSNFSVGQRQLVCLARAILRKNRVLVLDEATANVDPATDNLVQHTIRSKFSECTILTIAHRLQTVLDNDRIMILDVGKVVEFDSPEVLMKNEQSSFYAMLHHSSQEQTGENQTLETVSSIEQH